MQITIPSNCAMFHSSEFNNAWSLSVSPQDISQIAGDPIVIAIRQLLSGSPGLEQAFQGLDSQLPESADTIPASNKRQFLGPAAWPDAINP